ncbi:PKD domain-containing protein [Chryseolinea soli]|uniref:PKD domain-containing protein n=1 Tax=Chryseolinea soli TaxID=2321403 RepID=A0A385SPD9_9BACT|nr:PKD domain-containing protein [Chryseolinea soli]AYB32137.1 hypothetical protein D4L85_16855 [Chryseolinea soli]
MKKLNTKLLRSFLLLLLLPVTLMAQNFANYNWYFGNSPQGVRFSRSSNTASLVSNQAVPFGTGGSAVASDQTNGDLLFYTDGAKIYDITNAVMPNGTGLNGFTSGNQPVTVAKVPGQLNQFYVITNSANFTTGGSIEYRIVDMSLFGNAAFPTPALGDGTNNTNTAIAGLTNRSEAMIAIPHDNGDDFWLITHANGSPDYSVTLVTTTGPSTTTTFAGLGLINVAANFAYHAGTNRIAVSPQEGTRDAEILTFDPATGALTFQQRILNSGLPTTTNQSIYDIEFSPNGDLVYLSRSGEAGIQADVLQYNLIGGVTVSLASVLPDPNTIARSYGLQIGPDSAIYHLYQATTNGPFLLGKITDADSVAPKAIYTAQAFPGNIDFKGTQFPSFAPRDTVDLKVTFTADGLCANSPTSFYPTVTPSADSLSWDLGDGTGKSHDWSPVYTYAKDGTYSVTVTAYLNGQKATYTAPVTITPFDTQINLVQDTTACSCELKVQKASPPKPSCGRTFKVTAKVNGSGSPQLQWFGPGGLIPGATSATLQPDSAGYYYLVATAGGCSTYAGVNIKEYDVQDQRANIWFFGKNAGLDFNPPNPNNPSPPPVPNPIKNNVMDAPAGTSTISDRNGQVVLFTDGKSVWNRQEQLLSADIGGDPLSAQAALIIPVPGDETLYYIFTTKAVYGDGTFELRYTLFDLKMNNGTGGLVDPDGNPATTSPSTVLFTKSTERITGNANWLIAHEYGNNSFRAYKISQQGIGNPVISSIGSDHNYATAANGQGYMKLGAKNRLAVALSTPGVSNVVEVFDFADSSGTVSNFRTADLKNANGQVYGVELSSGGNKLFASLQGSGSSQIVEFAFDSLGMPYLKKPPIAPVGQKLGAIQLAPNGQVYVAAEGDTKLGVITVNEDTATVSQFQPSKQDLLAGTNSRLGLPNFIQNLGNPIQGPGLAVNGSCVQDSISFVGTPTDAIDTLDWTLLQGATVLKSVKNQASFKYLFAAPGKYQVKLHLHNRCGLNKLLTQDFEIFGAPPDPTTAVVLCHGPVAIDANPNDLPDLTYAWSTGATTETITVNKKALYKVTVTNKAGCTTDGEILASDSRPIIELGPNTTICQNVSIGNLDAQNPGATYAWTKNNVASGNTRLQAVDTSVPSPPTIEYEVTVTDPINTCFAKDSVIYTINPLPVIGPFNTTSPTTCGAADGTITNLSIGGTPSTTLYSYFIVGPSTSISDTDQSVGPLPDATGLAAGTYGITVADQVTGCATTTTASINDNTFQVNASEAGTLCDRKIQVALVATPGPITYPVNYTVYDKSTFTPVETLTANGTPFLTGSMKTDTYTVQVKSGACTASGDVNITVGAKVPVTLASDVCTTPNITLTATGPAGSTYLWSGPNIVGSNAAGQIFANPPVGNQTYNINIKQATFCDLDTVMTVFVDKPLLANYTQTDACANQVTLNATPNGAFTYYWFVNAAPTPDPTLGGPVVTVPIANDGFTYAVTIKSPVTGCTNNFSNTVQVDGTLTVALTSTPACEGSPFTLTATPSRSSVVSWALNGNTIPNQSSGTLQDTRGGNYTVTVTAATCVATADMDVIVNPTTPGFMKDEALICPDPANPDPNTREVVLDPGEFTSYDWFKDGVTLKITTPTLTASEIGLYSVNLVNGFGCASSDKTLVKEQCDPVIVGPNAFRPTSVVQGQGGDYVNQTFMLFTFFIDDQNFQVFIFNRWGEMIYQSNQRDFKWNGGYNNNAGQQAPPGTYTYLVRYQSSYRPEKGVQEKRGGVVLLR